MFCEHEFRLKPWFQFSTPLSILARLTPSAPLSPSTTFSSQSKSRSQKGQVSLLIAELMFYPKNIQKNIRVLVHAWLWIWVGALRHRGTTRYGIRDDLASLLTLHVKDWPWKPRGKSHIYWFIMKTDRVCASHVNGKWLVNQKKSSSKFDTFPYSDFVQLLVCCRLDQT